MPASPPSVAASPRWVPAAWAAILVLAALAAYHNTFRAPFVFDDIPAIVENLTLRHPGNLTQVLLPGKGSGLTVSGRPVLNLSLALCYAVSGTDVWSYHALNLLIHILAGLTLFGIVRRTLAAGGSWGQGAGEKTPVDGSSAARSSPASSRLRAPFPLLPGNEATLVAFTVALLWILHPLQTEAVTYLVQRAESLMGLFYLLTLYCFIRGAGADSPHPRRWFVAGFAACLLGMGTKEVMATAPLMVLLYDRTFVGGSFREAWRRHGRFHLALAATWLVLALLVASTGWNRGGTVGFSQGISPWAFWLTQFEAVARYLKQAFWPHPLIFEYGVFPTGFWDAAPYALVVLPLVAATLVALVRWPVAGFLGAWFFAILAPTSVVPGTTQMIVEHRMYLSLAAVAAGVVVGLRAALGRWERPSGGVAPWRWSWAALLPGLFLALPLGLLTERRNALYGDDRALWQQTVAVSPASAKAHGGLGAALLARHRLREAQHHFLIALALDPNEPATHYNLGLACAEQGRLPEAVARCREAIRINPQFSSAHYELGLVLMVLDQLPEALAELAEAVRLAPTLPEAHYEWGVALAKSGRWTDAVDQFQAALRLKPDLIEAECELGAALYQLDRAPEAVACFQRALQANPSLAAAHFNLGLGLARIGRPEQAAAEYAEAVRLDPAQAMAQYNLGIALGQAGRLAESLEHLQRAVQLAPAFAGAHCNLGVALAMAGRLPEAVAEYRTALRLRPDFASAHFNLGTVLHQLGRAAEAREHLEAALRLDPHLEAARQMLERQQTVPVDP